jgi:hypothetical protein
MPYKNGSFLTKNPKNAFLPIEPQLTQTSIKKAFLGRLAKFPVKIWCPEKSRKK